MSKLVPRNGEVTLRLYGVGLGDCFLLAFPGDPDPCYVVIDCGIAKGTPNDKELMAAILDDIADATGGRIDVLAVTHEHHDHVSGFALAEDQWRKLSIGKVWLPWIEGGGREADDIREVKRKLNLSVIVAQQTLAASGETVPLDLEIESDFLSGAEFGAGESMVVRGHRIAKELGGKQGENVVYCEPGEVRKLPRTDVNAYVLGPPHYVDRNKKDLVKGKKYLLKLLEDESEMYGYEDIGQTAYGNRSQSRTLSLNEEDLLANTLSCREDDMHQPFDVRYRIGWEEGMLDPFFDQFYSGGPEWRQINHDWLESASEMALRAGGLTNNISLVLAFELPQSKRVLLFPGDAQVGNWLSWHEISAWTGVDGGKPASVSLKAEELLNRVIFYKVGHHGSHNATLREKGLEMMALDHQGQRLAMVAYVPVSVPIAHDVMNYCPMPFYPVMKRLQDVTDGHVYLANGRRLEPFTDFSPTLPDAVEMRTSTDLHHLAKDGQNLETNLPLYTEFVVKDT